MRLKCSLDGCNNLTALRSTRKGKKYYRKICMKHHKEKYNMKKSRGKLQPIKTIKTNICVLCKWVGPCDVHRIKLGRDGGKYEWGNVIVLCPNCHRLVHRKLITLKIPF